MQWFRHDLSTRDSDQIFELIEAHGVQGYGIWWVILEECYSVESNGFQVEASETWFKRLSKNLNLTDWRTIIRVLDTMANLGLIDSQMWAEHIVVVPGISKRADDYMQKKAADAIRQKRSRDKKKQEKERNVTRDAPVTGVTNGDVTLSDSYSDSYSDSNSYSHSDPDPEKERVCENEFEIAERSPLENSGSVVNEEPKGDRHEQNLNSSAARFEAMWESEAVDPWQVPPEDGARWDFRRGQIDPDFCGWLTRHHLPSLSTYKDRGEITRAEAEAWVKGAHRRSPDLYMTDQANDRWIRVNAQWGKYQDHVRRRQEVSAPSVFSQQREEFKPPTEEQRKRVRELMAESRRIAAGQNHVRKH